MDAFEPQRVVAEGRSAAELSEALEREYERHDSEAGQLRVDLQQARRSWDYWQARALRFESLLERHAPDALKAAQEEAGPDCPF